MSDVTALAAAPAALRGLAGSAETFLAAWSARAHYLPERGTVRAWPYGIAVNLVRRHHRTERRQSRISERLSWLRAESGAGTERVDAETRVPALTAAIAALPAADRDVLLLTCLGGLDSIEVAVALDIPEGTVRSRLHRVRRSLRATLSASAEETR